MGDLGAYSHWWINAVDPFRALMLNERNSNDFMPREINPNNGARTKRPDKAG